MPKPRKNNTILVHQGAIKKKKSHKPDVNRATRESGAKQSRLRAPDVKPVSVIDRQAAEAVARLLRAAETQRSGATIKSLTLAPHVVHKKPTFAVTCETLRHLPLLQQLVEQCGLLDSLAPAVALVLAYEVLLGEGCRQQGAAEAAVMAKKADMQARLRQLKDAHAVQDTPALLARLRQGLQPGQAALELEAQHLQQPQPPQRHPRWARVNTLKLSLKAALRKLASIGHGSKPWNTSENLGAGTKRKSKPQKPSEDSAGGGAETSHSSVPEGVYVDELLPDLLRFPAGTDLHDHPMVAAGELVLQSKASCLVAHALAPGAGWTVVDCCAAPGNKTTHVAARLAAAAAGFAAPQRQRQRQRQPPGRVFAFDKDPRRLARLQANAVLTGAAGIISAEVADFLTLDPSAPRFADVRGVVLDPSCSGSGTAVSRMDHLLPASAAGPAAGAPSAGAIQAGGRGASGADAEGSDSGRVEKLARFQEAALRHALRFPVLQRLVYSTCSVHQRENEDVVAALLPDAAAAGFSLVDPFPTWGRRGVAGSLPAAEAAKVVRTDAALDGTDGFFVAVFERRDGAGQCPAAPLGAGAAPRGASSDGACVGPGGGSAGAVLATGVPVPEGATLQVGDNKHKRRKQGWALP